MYSRNKTGKHAFALRCFSIAATDGGAGGEDGAGGKDGQRPPSSGINCSAFCDVDASRCTVISEQQGHCHRLLQ